MTDNVARTYEVSNPQNPNCMVCEGLNSVYNTGGAQCDICFPDSIARGSCKRTVVRPSIEFTVTNMKFFENMTMSGSERINLLNFAFCLGEPLSFRMQESSKEIQINSGENYLFNQGTNNGVSRFESGQVFWGVNIRLGYDLLSRLFNNDKDIENALTKDQFRKSATSPSVNRILNDLLNCRYTAAAKTLYYEAKIMELLAVYFSETVLESSLNDPVPCLSKYDIECLQTAKTIIDSNLEAAPSIKTLARLVCMNEYKLKNGFRELFGVPVHTYIIGRRLDMARFLLESRNLKVIEAALMVGYSDASYFAEKFRERFGINPSECRK